MFYLWLYVFSFPIFHLVWCSKYTFYRHCIGKHTADVYVFMCILSCTYIYVCIYMYASVHLCPFSYWVLLHIPASCLPWLCPLRYYLLKNISASSILETSFLASPHHMLGKPMIMLLDSFLCVNKIWCHFMFTESSLFAFLELISLPTALMLV